MLQFIHSNAVLLILCCFALTKQFCSIITLLLRQTQDCIHLSYAVDCFQRHHAGVIQQMQHQHPPPSLTPHPPPSLTPHPPQPPTPLPPPLTPQLPHTPMTPQSHMGQAPPHSHMSQSPLTPHGHMSPSPMSSHPHTPMMPHTPQSMGQGHSVSNCMKWTNSLQLKLYVA